jgi:adhesin transport system outer membrane protein
MHRWGPCRGGGRIGVAAGIATALIALTGPAGAQAAGLTEAVQKALSSHPRVARADALARAAEHDVTNARAGYFPSIDLTGGIGAEDSNIKQLTDDPGTLTRREAGLSVRQLIYDGFLTRSEVERRRALLEAAEHSASDVRESIAFDAVQAYIDVASNRDLVKLARDNLDAHRATLERVRLKVSGGVGQLADQQQAEGRVALAQSTLTAREGRLREAETNYERVVGEAPGDLPIPARGASGLSAGGEVQESALQTAIDAATTDALAQHPALRQARAELTASEASVKVARAAYWPRVDVAGNLNRDANLSGVEGIRNTNSVMLLGEWNLFRGGGDRAQEQASVERRIAAEDTVADTQLAVRENVAIALKARATSEGRIAYLEQHVTASKAALESYKSQFELNRRTLLDLLNAENELFTARSNLSLGQYEDLLNQYFVEAAKGNLTATLGVAAAQ